MGKNTRLRKRGSLGRTPLHGLARSLIDGAHRLATDLPSPGPNVRLMAGCALAGLGLACATGPTPGILPTAEIMRHLERLELRDEEPALRLTKRGGRHRVYLTGRELEGGAVVVLEVRF